MNIKSPCDLNKEIFGLENPVALITGSGSARVGRTIAQRFHRAGFRVVLHAHRSVAEAQQVLAEWGSAGPATSLVVGDVSDEGEVERWRKEILSKFGRLDVLVNSAAIWDPIRLEDVRSNDFEHFFRINSLSTALMNQHFGLLMTEQQSGGAIVNISDWSIVRPYRDFAAYFPSKSAVISITQSMAVELAMRNPRVRVNAILPGPVLLSDEVTEERRKRIIEECLLRREGTPEDVAGAAMFLATSPFITGVSLPVDGGRTIYAGPSADPIAHPRVSLP
jgi:pteridine reductase